MIYKGLNSQTIAQTVVAEDEAAKNILSNYQFFNQFRSNASNYKQLDVYTEKSKDNNDQGMCAFD